MSKFKVGDRVRILSDARYSFKRTVIEEDEIKSAVGLVATISNIVVWNGDIIYDIYDLPSKCYIHNLPFWGYKEDQLELVDDNTARQDFIAQNIKAFDAAYLEGENGRILPKSSNDNPQDMVNHPAHYTSFPMELKDWNFAVMQTIKDPIYCAYFKTMSEYLHRAHLKNGLEDIKKLLFWGNELVKHVEDGKVEVK